MLSGIKTLLSDWLETEPEHIDRCDPLQLATAALMMEVATIDEHFDSTEVEALSRVLREQFQLDEDTLKQLLSSARKESDHATSLYQFTRCINDEFSPQDKYALALGLWRVAYADGNLDKYEEYMVRRICDLLHIAHGDFIRAKHQVRDDM